MSGIGRLELGEVETTHYDDPISGCEVEIKFRHAAPGDLAGSYADVGLDLQEKDGKTTVGMRDSESSLHTVEGMANADRALAVRCLISARESNGSGILSAESVYRPALIAIGDYIRKQSEVSPDEKKP